MAATPNPQAAEPGVQPPPRRSPLSSPRTGLGRARGTAALSWRRGLIGSVVLLVVGFAAVKGYQRIHPAPKAVAPIQTAAATRRSIVEAVSLPGTVASGRQSKLTFASASTGTSVTGRVESISVKTGDVVTTGQELARLNTTSLDLAVQSAMAALTVAQLKMQQLLAGATTTDLASAEQSVISARATLQKTQNDLQTLQSGPTAGDLAAATQGMLNAQNNLATAQTALDDAQGRADLATQYSSAQQAADRMSAQGTAARTDFDAVISTLTNAGGDPDTMQVLRTTADDLVNAVSVRCVALSARDNCAAIAAASAGDLDMLISTLNHEETPGAQDITVQLTAFNDAVSRAGASALREPTLRRVQATAALPGLTARAASLIYAQRGADGWPTAATLASALRTRDAASQALLAAKAKLDALLHPAAADVQAAQNAVQNAQAALNVAVAKRETTVGGPLPVDIAVQEQSVQQAQVNLQKANDDRRAAVLIAPFDGVIGAITMNIGEQSGSGSIVAIDPNAMQLQAAAQESDIAKIKVRQPVSLTFDAYSGTTLAGTVISVAPDATVTQGVASYAVVIGVSAQGGSAITAPGGTGQTTPRGNATGTPASGTPTARGTGGAARATPGASGAAGAASVTPSTGEAGAQAPQGNPNIVLRSGMTGTGSVEIQRHTNVLAVPSRAVKRQGRNSVVTVVVNGNQEVKTVQTGASDATYVEITSGLNEGDLVVIPSSTVTTSATTTTAAPLGIGGAAAPGFRPGG